MSGFGRLAAVILAAGSGRRLGPESAHHPKVLLRFGGRSLLERHVEILESFGVFDITIVVGHLASAVEDEIRRLGARACIRTIENPRYREGSVVSLWQAHDVLAGGGPILLMDGD